MSKIQALQEADAAAIFELLRDVYANPQFPLGGAWTLRLIEQELEKGRGLGLWENAQLVAFILYRDQKDVWDITLLATDLKRRRKGDMSHLLGALAARRPEGVEIWLEVHEANAPAVNLYKKLGFRQVGSRPGYYRDGRGALLFTFR